MNPQLASALERLSAEVRADPSRLPVLFWLRAYATLAQERGATGVRWAKLSGYVSRTAREFGVDGLDHAPGRALVTEHELFQVRRADDAGAVRGRAALLNLDWRGAEVELAPEFAADLPQLATWANEAWDTLRHSESLDGSLVAILARWAPEGRSGLLPALVEAQEALGWISPQTLAELARGMTVPLAEAYGVATYYKMLYTQPVGRKIVRVCDDVRCYLAGSERVLHELEDKLQIRESETTSGGEYTLERSPCLGHCDCAPIVQVNQATFEFIAPAAAASVLAAEESEPKGVARGPRLLKNIENPDVKTLAGYLAAGGFAALRKALFELQREQIIAEVKASGLVGRGGAAFPTGLKWELTAAAIKKLHEQGSAAPAGNAGGPRRAFGYIVCNADESEPGTFKDRILLERDPFRVLEGIFIAARAVGAERGYIYLRGEYPLAYRRLRTALEEARAGGYLGDRIAGSEFSFELEIRRGAGAYECGEETALFESIEGKRGEPRVKPPFPVEFGVFGRPTIINNVETLANIPFIIEEGAAAYRSVGTEKSPGTRLVCLSGQVKREGVYEIAMGTTLRQVIDELGGGLHTGRQLQAVLIGGAAGAFLTPAQIDTPLAFESLNAVGATFGSGAVFVLDDSADLWGVLTRIARFFRDESCGKCFPCQLGTQRQLEIVERMAASRPRAGDRLLLFEVGQTMRDASLCGLGQFAPNAILSAFDRQLVNQGD